MPVRRRAWPLIAALALLGAAGLVVDVGWGVRVPGAFGIAQPQVWALAGLLPLYAVAVALVSWRPREPVSRLLFVMAFAMSWGTALGAVTTRIHQLAGGGSWLWVLAYLEHHLDLAGPAAMGTMFILFPDGRAHRRYERRVVTGYWTAVLVLPTLMMVSHRDVMATSYSSVGGTAIPSPLFISALAWLGPVTKVLVGLGAMMGIAGAALLVVRYRRLAGRQRLQTAWLALAALFVAVDLLVVQYLGVLGVVPHTVQVSAFYAAWVPALLSIPATIGVALVRHQLFDIRLVIRRSLLFTGVSGAIGGLYVAVAAAAGITTGQRASVDVAVMVTIVAVLALQPARRRLVALADRWAYGERLDGYQLLSGLGTTLAHAYDLTELAPQLATGIRTGLGLRWCRVSLCLPQAPELLEPLGADGIGAHEPAEPAVTLPLVDADTQVGLLEIGPAERRTLTARDHELLADLARQSVLAVRNAHLTAELTAQVDETRRQAGELEASRGRIIAATDEERRRIERNIHDGVQQQIVALMAKLRLARNQLARSEQLEATLAEMQTEAAQTLEDLRELARGIHPPVLTDRGLLEALESRITRLPGSVQLTAGPELRGTRYSDDIEGAAYFFACEAIANALKHADADTIEVALTDDGERLRISVTDDGVGFAPAEVVGSGVSGIADRIEAVGGVLTARSQPGSGARLVADLPVRGRRSIGV